MAMLPTEIKNQRVFLPGCDSVSVSMKRLDLWHPVVSGNKFFKLKYNLEAASKMGAKRIVTFGGAFSNHIAACAYACKYAGFESIGIIRGEELAHQERNATLRFAESCGMQLQFVSREIYSQKQLPFKIASTDFIVPEGGANAWGVQGCREILSKSDSKFDFIAVSLGTGVTAAGLSHALFPQQQLLVFSALKGTLTDSDFFTFADANRCRLFEQYHGGGYAKCPPELVYFINDFYKQNGFLLDPIYTGKMMFGLGDLVQNGFFKKGAKILAIHTGGLQAISGMNARLKANGLLEIQTEL